MMEPWQKMQAEIRELIGDDMIKKMRRFLKEKKYEDFPAEIRMKTPNGTTLVTTPAKAKEHAEMQLSLIDAQNRIDFINAKSRLDRWLNLSL